VTVGTLVVLHGASSTGKITIVEALRSLVGLACPYIGLDRTLGQAQPFEPQPRTRVDRLRWSMRIVAFRLTDGRVRLTMALHREVATVVCARHHVVVVETALMDQRALCDAAACFAPLGRVFVGLTPLLDVSER